VGLLALRTHLSPKEKPPALFVSGVFGLIAPVVASAQHSRRACLPGLALDFAAATSAAAFRPDDGLSLRRRQASEQRFGCHPDAHSPRDATREGSSRGPARGQLSRSHSLCASPCRFRHSLLAFGGSCFGSHSRIRLSLFAQLARLRPTRCHPRRKCLPKSGSDIRFFWGGYSAPPTGVLGTRAFRGFPRFQSGEEGEARLLLKSPVVVWGVQALALPRIFRPSRRTRPGCLYDTLRATHWGCPHRCPGDSIALAICTDAARSGFALVVRDSVVRFRAPPIAAPVAASPYSYLYAPLSLTVPRTVTAGLLLFRDYPTATSSHPAGRY